MHMHNTVYYQKQEEKNAVYCGTFAKKYLEADWDVAPVAKSFAVEIKNIIWKPLQYCLLAIPSPGIMANGQEPRPHRQNTFQTF